MTTESDDQHAVRAREMVDNAMAHGDQADEEERAAHSAKKSEIAKKAADRKKKKAEELAARMSNDSKRLIPRISGLTNSSLFRPCQHLPP